jgi:hypothetical protein
MKKYTQITITKISDHGGVEKTPTHALTTYDENKKKLTVGKLWTKSSDYGKFLSGLMSDEYTNPAGQYYDGYVIVSKKELELLEQELELYKSGKAAEPEDDGLTSAGTKVPDFSEVDLPF